MYLHSPSPGSTVGENATVTISGKGLGNVIPIALNCNWLTREWCAVRPTANGDASSATDSAIVTVKVKKPEEQLRLNTATGVRPVPQ